MFDFDEFAKEHPEAVKGRENYYRLQELSSKILEKYQDNDLAWRMENTAVRIALRKCGRSPKDYPDEEVYGVAIQELKRMMEA